MCKFLGNRRDFLKALLAVIFLSVASAADCHAQIACPTPPVITSVQPSQWPIGQTFAVQIMGTNLVNDPATNIFCNEVTPQVGESTGQVSFSPFSYDPYEPTYTTQIDAVATVPSTVPAENACVFVSTWTIYAAKASRIYGVPELDPPPGLANGTGAPCTGNSWVAAFSVQIVASGPTITSVAPLGWWAGQKQDITITGSGFLTASASGGPSQVTATGTGVTLSNVTVVSATQITASIRVAKDAPAETVTLTVTNPPSGSSPNSATASPAPVVLPVPVIQWRGKKISGDNANTQKVKAGQPVELTTIPATLPGGFTISQSTWDIDGTTIKSYAAGNNGITLEETDLDTQNTSFYWLYPDDGLNATYTYCATDPSGNQYCTSPQAKATFNASGPNSSLSTTDSGEATIEQLEDCDSNGNVLSATEPDLGYGDLSGPGPTCVNIWETLGMPIIPQTGTPGIKLMATGISNGKAVFVQLIDSDSRTYTSPSGSATCTHTPNLDTGYPYPSVANAPSIAADGPEIPLPSPDQSAERDFVATMYLLWQPGQLKGTSTQSIPVPIGYQQWAFSASTDQKQPIGKGKWMKPTLTAHGDTGSYAASQNSDNTLHGYPIFTAPSVETCPTGN